MKKKSFIILFLLMLVFLSACTNTEQVATEQVATEQVATEQVATEQVATEQVVAEQVATEQVSVVGYWISSNGNTITLTEDGKIRTGDKVGTYTIYDTSKLLFDIEPPVDYEFEVKGHILFLTDLDGQKKTGYFKDDHPCFVKVQEKQEFKKKVWSLDLSRVEEVVKSVKKQSADGECTKEEFLAYWFEHSALRYSESESGQAAKRSEEKRLSAKYDEYMEIADEIDRLNKEIEMALNQ